MIAAASLLKHWKLIAGGLVLLTLCIMLAMSRADVRHFKKLYEGEKTARALEQAEVRRVRAEQQAADAQHVLKIKAAEEAVSQEVSNGYQTRLTDLQRRLDAERLRWGKAQTLAGGSGKEVVPVVPDSSGGSDDPFATSAIFNCAANTIQLDALQSWIREQVAIER